MRRSLWLCLLMFPSARVLAQSTTLPPSQYFLNLKGTLTSNAGVPLSGNHSVQYRLYDGSGSTANLVWNETKTVNAYKINKLLPNLPDKLGRYAVTLGLDPNNPLPRSKFYTGNATNTLWLEIWVDNQAPPIGTLRKQLLQIPADSTTSRSMNQVVWVTNALDHIESNKLLEAAALAFYVRQIYAKIPNADPNFVTLSLIKAEGVFNQRYRSASTGGFRVSMQPIDAVTNLYGILVQQPGNPVVGSVIAESLTFAAGNLQLATGSQAYQQFSYELGRMSSSATYNQYLTTQLEQLYLLARQNPNAASVVDTFFGFGFNENVADSASTILNKNTTLRDSANFAPLNNQIEADGTMLSTLDTALANIADFYDRMTMATIELNKAVNTANKNQSNDYVGSVNTQNTATTIQAAINVAFSNAAPGLTALGAGTYAAQVQMLDTSKYQKYQLAVDGLRMGADILAAAADTTSAIGNAFIPGQEVTAAASGISAGKDAVLIAADALVLSADAGAFGPSQLDAIQDGITQLSAQLSSVQKDIDGRLQIMDSHIIALYDQMGRDFASVEQAISAGFTNISSQIATLQTDVISLQYGLDRLTQSFSNFETISSRATTLAPYLTQINNWGNTNPPTSISASDFNGPFSFCQNYATSTTKTILENGNFGVDGFSGRYGDSDIAGQLDGDSTKNLNYLQAFVANRFYNHDSEGYTSPAIKPTQANEVGNPVSWEMSSLGMMRAATLYYDTYGKSYIQATNSSFQGAYHVGQQIQTVANSLTVQGKINPANGNPILGPNKVPILEKSPVLNDMLLHQSKMATSLYNAIVTEKNTFIANYPTTHGAGTTPSATEIIQDIAAQINQHGTTVSNAADNLDGSRRLMEQMYEFGLSRSLKSGNSLGTYLYSSGNSNFRDTTGTAAADPNAQRLPDGTLVRAMYHNWVSSIPAAPTTAPTVNVVNNSGSTIPAGYYYVTVSYRITPATATDSAESYLSAETMVTINSGQAIQITAPTLPAAALNYRVYIGSTSGGPYYLQNSGGTTKGQGLTLTSYLSNLSSPPAQQYNSYLTADPLTIFTNAQNSRFTALRNLVQGYTTTVNGNQKYIPGLLDQIASDANSTQTGIPQGEQISNVDAILSRLGFFLIPSVNGTISGKPLAGLPANQQPRSFANTVVNFQFYGLNSIFAAPVLLDATGGYTVNVPRDTYTILAKQDGFLQGKLLVPGTGAAISTLSGSVQNATAQLYPGDIIGHNLINNSDMIALRNALGSVKLQPGWNPVYDLNGDGVVDNKDLALIQAQIAAGITTPAQFGWIDKYDVNSDGKLDSTDVSLMQAVIRDPLRNRPSSFNWNSIADLNGDGKVDALDLAMLRANFGRSGDR